MAVDPVTLNDGTRIRIRAIEPADRDALAAGFERLSPESRYRRFFSPVNRLSDRQLDYLTRVDHHDHEALIALAEASERLIGVARFVRTGAGEAEPAMVVADDWHGRGVATALLERLVDRAFDEGIVTFNAPVLAGNADAIKVLERLGDTDLARRGTEVELRIRLRERATAADPLHALLRAVAAGTIDPALSFWHRLLPRSPRGAGEGDHANLLIAAVADVEGESPAIPLAQEIAEAGGAQVIVVAARHPLLDDREAIELRIRRVAARMRSHGVAARPEVRAGDLAAIVLDVATEEHARLIVVEDLDGVDATGRLIGEPWDHISHHAPCSVLVARR